MKDFLEYIIKNLVDNPEAAFVTEYPSPSTIIYEVNLDKPDFGKVIGKKGRNIDAIRTLCLSIAAKNKLKIMINIKE